MFAPIFASAVALAALGVAVSPAPTTPPETITMRWIMPVGSDWPQLDDTDANFTAVPCGTTVRIQVDTYRYSTDAEKAKVNSLDDDGRLTWDGGPEDSSVYLSHYYESFTAPVCVEPSPEPTVEPEPTTSPEPTVAPEPSESAYPPVAPPVEAPVVVAEAPAADVPELAATGADITAPLVVGGGLLLAGIAALSVRVFGGRRNRA